MTEPKHLWEYDHPYYATEGCYYARGDQQPHTEYETWTEFYDDFAHTDLDMNLVYRWDWSLPDSRYGNRAEPETLKIYIIGQRKALPSSHYITGIRREDEPAVIEWLTPRAQRMVEIWAPLIPQPQGKSDG